MENKSEANMIPLSFVLYDRMKHENERAKLFVECVCSQAKLSEDRQRVVFSSSVISQALKICYPESYRRCRDSLRGRTRNDTSLYATPEEEAEGETGIEITEK